MQTPKPVGTVMYRNLSRIEPGMFEVAIHTKNGWICVDQDDTYPFTQPAEQSPWPWTTLSGE